MTAYKLFEMYADKNGFVSIEDILREGWTKDMAENEGIIIKETFNPIRDYTLKEDNKNGKE